MVFGTLALRWCDVVALTSEEDARQFGSDIRSKAVIVANGFDSDVFHRKECDTKNRVLFFGNMSYEPNQEAVEAIGNNIAPALAERCPETAIHIAGPNCSKIQDAVANNNNVEVVGLVDEIAPYIRESKVVIVPLETGSGTRLKIIESLACGTFVVSTEKGAEGWPDRWKNLDKRVVSAFPAAIEEYLCDGQFEDDEYESIRGYSWEDQMTKIVTEIRRVRGR
jgi:glycosyltransferase involved in cell wall biosynthesis